MKAIRNFLLSADRSKEGRTTITRNDGTEVVLQTEILSHRKGHYNTQKATVVSTPQAQWKRYVEFTDEEWKFEDGSVCNCDTLYLDENGKNYVLQPILKKFYEYPVEINDGDTVYVHHHVVSDENGKKVEGNTLYPCTYFEIFGVEKSGKFFPVEDWTFCEPIPYEGEYKSGLLIPHFVPSMTQKGFQGQEIGEFHPSEAIVRYTNSDELKPGDRIIFYKDADYKIEIEGKQMFRIKLEHVLAKA